MENLASIVGHNLATLRKAKGLTQQDLAERVNYSDKSISKWELGYSLPSVDILKDFASFYGVTVDYLIQEQTAEELQKTAAEDSADEKAKQINQGLIIALTATFGLLVAISVYFSSWFNPFIPENAARYPGGLWVAFIWMVPLTLLPIMLECWRYYHKKKLNVILGSVFAWTTLLSFCFQFQFFNVPSEQIWHVLSVGVPIQIMLILWGNFRPRPKKAKKE